jgi:hypothetical protein
MTQFGPGRSGQGKSLRQILDDIDESDEEMLSSPLYQQGFEDGRAKAETDYRKLLEAMSAVYKIGR